MEWQFPEQDWDMFSNDMKDKFREGAKAALIAANIALSRSSLSVN
jgi:hypothetical protein